MVDWQFSKMIFCIFLRVSDVTTKLIYFFSSFVFKVAYGQFVGLFGETVPGVLLPLIFFEGVYNSSHQPSEFPEGKLL